MTDAIPAVTTFISLTAPTGWTSATMAVGGTGTVTTPTGYLASGAASIFTLTVKITASIESSISNTGI